MSDTNDASAIGGGAGGGKPVADPTPSGTRILPLERW
jgi:hypothetical protein